MKKIIKVIVSLLILNSCKVQNVSNTIATNIYYHYKTIEPYIALTFDDGPDKVQTIKVLEILKKYEIKATFFVIGERIEYQKDILKKIVDEGHEIGNHFYSHENINKISKEKIRESIMTNNELIYSITGKMPKLVRPQYGIVNDNLKTICQELNMSIIIWSNDKDSKDWKQTKDNIIINNLTKKVSNGDIFLFHDGNKKYTNTLSAIDTIIPMLQKKGFKFVDISTLIKK